MSYRALYRSVKWATGAVLERKRAPNKELHEHLLDTIKPFSNECWSRTDDELVENENVRKLIKRYTVMACIRPSYAKCSPIGHREIKLTSVIWIFFFWNPWTETVETKWSSTFFLRYNKNGFVVCYSSKFVDSVLSNIADCFHMMNRLVTNNNNSSSLFCVPLFQCTICYDTMPLEYDRLIFESYPDRFTPRILLWKS